MTDAIAKVKLRNLELALLDVIGERDFDLRFRLELKNNSLIPVQKGIMELGYEDRRYPWPMEPPR